MTFSIRIKENERDATPWRFEKEFESEADFQNVERHCINRKRIFLEGNLYVVRTDTAHHFCKDFFFPCVERALKVHNYIEKIFAVIGAVIFDLLTIPIRCITLLPRLLINWMNSKEKHPLHKYLVEQNADPRILNCNHVYMQKVVVNGDKMDIYKETFNFIEMPSYEHEATKTTYINIPA